MNVRQVNETLTEFSVYYIHNETEATSNKCPLSYLDLSLYYLVFACFCTFLLFEVSLLRAQPYASFSVLSAVPKTPCTHSLIHS